MIRLPRFYLVVDSADWCERLVPHGVELVQLRVKDMEEGALRAEVRRARDICARHGTILVINDYWRIAIDEGCDFVHLGQEDLADADISAIRRAGMRLGLSTHDRAELATALAAEPDYVALGPIWPTILKSLKWDPQTPRRLRDWKDAIGDLPLVAIGGLTVERADAVFENGADCAAVVTDVLRATSPEARLAEWLEKTRKPL